jgi:alkyldihydroxyacetonephosphate synthase
LITTMKVEHDLIQLLDETKVSSKTVDKIAYSRDTFPLSYKWAQMDGARYQADCIVYPETTEEVATVLRYCHEHEIPVTPYGGGSGIVGGGIPQKGGVVLDLKRMNRLLYVHPDSLYATAQCGIMGMHYEEQLNAVGLTGGHYPQSIRSSTVGGWVANRGIGTYSTKYGKIDDLVESLTVVLPNGNIVRTRNVPKSATGPNLNELFIGSEGTLGIITEVTLKVFQFPEVTEFISYSFSSFAVGVEAIRKVMHQDVHPAIVRLYDAREAETHFSDLGLLKGESVLLLGFVGKTKLVRVQKEIAEEVCGAHGNPLGSTIGEKWLERRFSTAGLCNTLRTEGGIADALEITATWEKLPVIYEAMKSAMDKVICQPGEVFGHVSHVYHTGGNLYMIFHAFANRNQETEELYDKILSAAFEACLANGGTLSHHHGVGIGKAKWMPEELGEAGFTLLQAIKQAIDPKGILNKGTLGL